MSRQIDANVKAREFTVELAEGMVRVEMPSVIIEYANLRVPLHSLVMLAVIPEPGKEFWKNERKFKPLLVLKHCL